jgi:hypothetical protein
MVLSYSLSFVKIRELVESHIVNSKAYELLVLMAVMLLASLSSVRKGRGL